MSRRLFPGLFLVMCMVLQSAAPGAAGADDATPAMTREACASVGGAEFAQCQGALRSQKDIHSDPCVEARQLAQRRCMLDVLENLNRDPGASPTRKWQGPAPSTAAPAR